MTDMDFEAFCNEIDFLRKEVDILQEQNKKLMDYIIKNRRK